MSKKETRAKRKRKTSRGQMVTLLMLGLFILIAALPTAIVVMVGVVPALVAYIIDTTPGRYACRCVALVNSAGVAIYVQKLWDGSNNLAGAIGIISDPFAWLAFYGSAAIGWGLFHSLPKIVVTMKEFNANRQIQSLISLQRDLVDEWGVDVRGKLAPTDVEAPTAEAPEPKTEEPAAVAPGG